MEKQCFFSALCLFALDMQTKAGFLGKASAVGICLCC